MSRISALSSTLILGLFFCGAAKLQAQDLLPRHASADIVVHPAATAADQLKQASVLWMRIYSARTPDARFAAIAETFENLAVIERLWPHDQNAVLQSAILRGDLALEWHFPYSGINALKDNLVLAAGTSFEPAMERRLAEAYSEAGDLDNAEAHFAAAERALHSMKVDPVQAQSVLNASARFQAQRRRNPREAMKRYRELAARPDENPAVRVLAALESVRQSFKIADDPEWKTAKEELATLDQEIASARGGKMTPQDAKIVETVAREARALSEKH